MIFGAKDMLDLAVGLGLIRAILDLVDLIGADGKGGEDLVKGSPGDENLGIGRGRYPGGRPGGT
jgi:hypothetical protein